MCELTDRQVQHEVWLNYQKAKTVEGLSLKAFAAAEGININPNTLYAAIHPKRRIASEATLKILRQYLQQVKSSIRLNQKAV